MYGGHITDFWDRRTNNAYLRVLIKPELMERYLISTNFTAPDANKTEYDPTLHSRYLRGRRIRWGAYGDPAILTESVVRDLTAIADGHTGYTHQWRHNWAQWCRGLFQASCDSFADYLAASDAGWRTFAVVPVGAVPTSGKLCPATAPGSQAACATCRLCDGAKTDIHVVAHGAGAAHVQPATALA